MTFYDVCCGSAAVSLTHMYGSKLSLCRYWGSKLHFSEDTLRHMSVPPTSRYVLADAGYSVVAMRSLRERATEVLRWLASWRSEDPEVLWRVLSSTTPGRDEVFDAATWLVLQAGAALGKQVFLRDGRWVTAGQSRLSPSAVKKGFKAAFSMEMLFRNVATVAGVLEQNDVAFLHGPVGGLDLVVAPGDVVYLDPPYNETTGYNHSFSRDEVVRFSLDAAARGGKVFVAEKEPVRELLLVGWRQVPVSGNHWSYSSPHKKSNKLEFMTFNGGLS